MRVRSFWIAAVGFSIGVFGVVAVVDLPTPASPRPLFWYTVVVTLLCAVLSKVLIAIAYDVRQPELAILGSGLFAASMFPFVHGMLIPGVLVSEATGAMSFGAWAGLPAGLLVASPALSHRVPWRGVALRHWRVYAAVTVVAVYLASSALLVHPDWVPAASFDRWWTIAGAALAFLGAQVLAHGQIRLYEVGRRRSSIAAAIGFAWLGVSSVVWLIPSPNDAIVWVAHFFDGLGVLGAAGGLVVAHRNDRPLTAVMAPVFNRDPSVALRLGVTPQIEAFVAMLDEKDRSTAGHVTRVAELAMRLGERAGFKGERLRNLGLGALLHDIGKVRIPAEILTKPDRLTSDEFEIVKMHTLWGQEILASDPLLAPVGRLVRHHHERIDGRGYPDGLRGDAIPVDVCLIAVADAWDAMVQTRHYRPGMSDEQARSIFREHAGSQWSDTAVELLFAQLDHDGELTGVFTDLTADGDHHICADALDTLPPVPVPQG